MMIGILVSSMKSDWGTVMALSGLPPSVMEGGTSPWGNGSRSPARMKQWRGHSCS
jgi:hypothetical protein